MISQLKAFPIRPKEFLKSKPLKFRFLVKPLALNAAVLSSFSAANLCSQKFRNFFLFFQVIGQPDLCQRLRVGPMVAGEAQDDRGRVEEVRPRPQPDERGGGSFEGKSACSF